MRTVIVTSLMVAAIGAQAAGQSVTYQPYIQPGDAGPLGERDQMVIAWQTNETVPHPLAYVVEFGRASALGSAATVSGRVVDNYLSADRSLPVPPTATGPRVNYTAVLGDLQLDQVYHYRVSGPGLAPGGFTASFRTRTRSGRFSFLVQGDEGFFPPVPGSAPPRLADYEARIVHEMYHAADLNVPGAPRRPVPRFALNTGDNVYTFGAEDSYRDFWMPVWNSDKDSNESGAPFIRRFPFYIVIGNHDIGGSGDRVNLLATDSAARFSGNAGGGNLLAYYNNYYFSLNGPEAVDPYQVFDGDASTPTGFYFQYVGKNYTSQAAAEALRASTGVDTGRGETRQIDHMSNYSFDQGNAHFLFLDANPHLFDNVLIGAPTYAVPPTGFPSYPSVLRDWIARDLDGSNQLWKVVVFHQPAFSSGNATLQNNQMRAVAKLLEDHGVNVVFNGHEHNYQRTHPLRALPGVAQAPSTLGSPVVAIDQRFDGTSRTVPDGVIYVVEGAGGNRDFDGALASPRGQGPGVDEEDSATGSFTYGPGLTFPNGPAAWLDTHLTNTEMAPFFGAAGSGPKITARFKAKVFSFAQVVVNDGAMTLYQITEPLLPTSSATPSQPAPFGTDAVGSPLNDPIPDTLVDPATGLVVTPPAEGTPALLDRWSIMRPDLSDELRVQLQAPSDASPDDTHRLAPGGTLPLRVDVENGSSVPLNGTQVVVTLPAFVDPADVPDETHALIGRRLVVTLGRLDAKSRRTFTINLRVSADPGEGDGRELSAVLRSSTALPVASNRVELDF
jgi:hypothetical protein